jgi:hypothetical protein
MKQTREVLGKFCMNLNYICLVAFFALTANVKISS